MSDVELFKVVWTDGYARETVAEKLVVGDLTLADAEAMRDRLCLESRDESNWWTVKPQNAPLWRGMAEFV